MTSQTSTLDFQVPVVTCELCQENRAEYYCQDCQEEMCGQCKTAHLRSKVSRHHTVIVSVLGKTESETKTPIKCSKHSTEKIQMHCNNCEIPVCHNCIADVKHKHHSFEKLEITLERYKREMRQIISETKRQISELEKFLQTIDDNVKDYNTISDETVSEINKQRQQIKSQADNIADGLIDKVEKRKTQDLQLMAKKKDDVVMSITDQKEFLQNCEESLKSTHDYTNLQPQIKKSTKPNPPSITYINPPTFVGVDTPDLQDRFGKLIETKSNKMITSDKGPQKKDSRTDHSSLTTISREIVYKIRTGENIYLVSAVNDKEAWCGCRTGIFGTGQLLLLVDTHGQIKSRIQTDYLIFDIALTSEGELLVTQNDGTCINKSLPDGKCIKIGKTNPYMTQGLSLTSSGDILVCLFNTCNDNKVVRMNTAGHIKQTISKDKGQQPLFTYPQYVAENINGDVVVVDKVYPAPILVVDNVYPATIIVVDNKGELRYKYPDSVQSSNIINECFGIACDNTGCILVSDRVNHRIHQIDIDGRFVQFVLTQQHGIQYPRGLSIDNKGQLWVCNNDRRELTVFKYRSS